MATNWTQDVSCMGAFLMEDGTTETDVSPNGNNITVSASDTIPVSSIKKFGLSSRDFELADAEYMTHADGLSTDISGANQAISLVTWVRYESVPTSSNAAFITKTVSTTNQRQYRLAYNGTTGVHIFQISSDGTIGSTCAGATTPTTGQFYHVAGVYNDTDIRIYLDGILDSSVSNPTGYTGGIFGSSAAFGVGATNISGTPSEFFDGLIDDVGVFNIALTSTDVNEIMTYGLNGQGISAIMTLNRGWWGHL